MSVASHVETLRMKHQNLSVAVESLQKRLGADTLEIVALKREKPRLKQQITWLPTDTGGSRRRPAPCAGRSTS